MEDMIGERQLLEALAAGHRYPRRVPITVLESGFSTDSDSFSDDDEFLIVYSI